MATLDELVEWIQPGKTSLLLGAGASIPSGGPSWQQLADDLRSETAPTLSIEGDLPLIADIIERSHGRRAIVDYLRERLDLSPVGGMAVLPNYPWKSVYTTNYDRLFEKAAESLAKPIAVVRSNYDLPELETVGATPVFKLHGCISQDGSYGDPSSMVITKSDYRRVREWKKQLFNRMQVDLEVGRLLIVGYGMSDPHLDEMIDELISLQDEIGLRGRVALLLRSAPPEIVALYESRGFYIAQGDIDVLLARILDGYDYKNVDVPESTFHGSDSIIGASLSAISFDVSSMIRIATPARKMYAGASASYYDISQGRTFQRDAVSTLTTTLYRDSLATIVGSAGLGKTTLARQVLMSRRDDGLLAWEHRPDLPLSSKNWLAAERRLSQAGIRGCLLLDDAHGYMREVNELIKGLSRQNDPHLEVLVVSDHRRWRRYMKHPRLANSSAVKPRRLSEREIRELSRLVEASSELQKVVPQEFLYMADHDRISFLKERCRSDVFICLKNLFASEAFDKIILDEISHLEPQLRDVYIQVAALEAIATGCHRQLVLRSLQISPEAISEILEDLEGLLAERTSNEVEGIYVWRTRHPEIAKIVAKHFYASPSARLELLWCILRDLNPTLRIELNLINGICNSDLGLLSIHVADERIALLERLEELAPFNRVVRHRMLRELISSGELPEAQNYLDRAIVDVGIDPPLSRYQVLVYQKLAKSNPAQCAEYLQAAWNACEDGERRFSDSWYVYRSFCEVAEDFAALVGDLSYAERAAKSGRAAFERLCEEQLEQSVRRVESLLY